MWARQLIPHLCKSSHVESESVTGCAKKQVVHSVSDCDQGEKVIVTLSGLIYLKVTVSHCGFNSHPGQPKIPSQDYSGAVAGYAIPTPSTFSPFSSHFPDVGCDFFQERFRKRDLRRKRGEMWRSACWLMLHQIYKNIGFRHLSVLDDLFNFAKYSYDFICVIQPIVSECLRCVAPFFGSLAAAVWAHNAETQSSCAIFP